VEFEAVRQTAFAEWKALEKSDNPRIYITTSSCSRASGNLELLQNIHRYLKNDNIAARVVETGCMGACSMEPIVAIAKPGSAPIYYGNVTSAILAQLITDWVTGNNPRADLALWQKGSERVEGIPDACEWPTFKLQQRIALRRCGLISPREINDAIANGAYKGLVRALAMDPESVVREANVSGVRDRDSGVLVSETWEGCRSAPGEKYVLCATAEIPGSLSERILWEGDPHAVLEGMLITAYAVGATRGYLRFFPSYGNAISIAETAKPQMERCGFLGNNILGTPFSFDLEIQEEIGLFSRRDDSDPPEGHQGDWNTLRTRLLFPAAVPEKKEEFLVHGAETLAHISACFQKDAETDIASGAREKRDTKIITLAGNIACPGPAEVPVSTTLRQVVYDIGGGIPDGKRPKAFQVGGPAAGWFPVSVLDLPVDDARFRGSRSIVASDSIVVADTASCIVDLVKHSVSYFRNESCGRCVFCREGTIQMFEVLTAITEGRGRVQDVDLLIRLSEGIQLGASCSFGRAAANPVLTMLNHFREEFEIHINAKRCPAGVCKNLCQSLI
jgi:NADH-quinone oxidoreductase subunit F